MSVRHLVRPAAASDGAGYSAPSELWLADALGASRWPVVDEDTEGAVHTGFALWRLAPGGSIPAHVHSFEESFFLLDGEAVLNVPTGSRLLLPGDYGVLPVGTPHAWRNMSGKAASWAEMLAPQPRSRFGGDTQLVAPLAEPAVRPVDIRDPRTHNLGHIDPAHMDVSKQGQQHLAVSASMRTALLVYSGITVKMMVDANLGAQLLTMFMVQYEQDGVAGPHDHPFEETYLILEGATDAEFDGVKYHLVVGDVAWAGAGCVHSFRNAGSGPVRWLETQAPQPPAQHSYRYARDWDYLRAVLTEE